MFLEVILKKELIRLITEKNINNFKFIIEALNSKNEYFNQKFDQIFFDKFANFLVNYCFLFEFSFDKMNSCLKIFERFYENLYISEDFFSFFLKKANNIYFNCSGCDNFTEILLLKDFLINNEKIDDIDTYVTCSKDEIERNNLKQAAEILENQSFFDNFENAIVNFL